MECSCSFHFPCWHLVFNVSKVVSLYQPSIMQEKKYNHFVLHVDYVTFIIPLCLFDSMSDTIDCCKGIVDMSTHIWVNLLGSHWSYPLSLNHISILWPVLIVANYPVTPPHSLQALGRSHNFSPLKIKSTYSSNSQISQFYQEADHMHVKWRLCLHVSYLPI